MIYGYYQKSKMKKENNIIPAGTTVCSSVLGHNNFIYPCSKEAIVLTENVTVQELSFAGGGELTAYMVLGTNKVVWTEKKYIKQAE